MAAEREQLNDAAAVFERDLSGGTPRSMPDRGDDGRFLSRSGNNAEQLFEPRQLADDPDIIDPDDAKAILEEARRGKGRRRDDDGEEEDSGGEGRGEDDEEDGSEAGEEEGSERDDEEDEGVRTKGPEGLDLETRVRVTVDGKPKEVSLGEAIKGYIRVDTFHQRLQEVDNERSTVRAERGELTKVR